MSDWHEVTGLTRRAAAPQALRLRSEGWQEKAPCAEVDPELWFPEKGGSTREAKRTCASCSVQAECLDAALASNEDFGIWGGLSTRERGPLRGRADDHPCQGCGNPVSDQYRLCEACRDLSSRKLTNLQPFNIAPPEPRKRSRSAEEEISLTQQLAVARHLANGREPGWVEKACKLSSDQVHRVGTNSGYPNTIDLTWAADRLASRIEAQDRRLLHGASCEDAA